MNTILKKSTLASVMSTLLVGVSFASCNLESYKKGWSGSLTFQCDEDTNLTAHPIQFQLSDGVTAGSVWGLSGAPTDVKESNGVTSVLVGKKWHPVEDYVLPANTSVTLSFSPSNSNFNITNFNVGSKPVNQGSVVFKQSDSSDELTDQTIITLTPSTDSDSSGYKFTWDEVKTGAAQLVNSGAYIVSVKEGENIVSTTPSKITVKTNESNAIELNYHHYDSQIVLSLNLNRPLGAGDVSVNIYDKTSSVSTNVLVPWGENKVTIGNLIPDHTYVFTASEVIANNNRYNFSFSPSEVITSEQENNYSIQINSEQTPIITHRVHVDVAGLPNGVSSLFTVKNSDGNAIGSESVGNISRDFFLPEGEYTLQAQTVLNDGYKYTYNNGQQKNIKIYADDQNTLQINFEQSESASVVYGWPNYLSMGAVTDANTLNVGQLKGSLVDAIFKYAGDGGNGDPGKIVYPIYTKNTVDLSESLSRENNHTVKPVMVVYTAEMSGGTAYKDLNNEQNLTMHFINLMLVSQVLQSEKSDTGDVGSIVLNPDLLGMVQQQKLYHSDTGVLGNGTMEGQDKLSRVEVQRSLEKAYWFVTTAHNWNLSLLNGSSLEINNATPVDVMLNAFKGDYKKDNIYSAWDLKSAWEVAAINILNQTPSNIVVKVPTFSNDFKGWIQATNWAIKAAGPDVTYGWQENVWNENSANWVHNDFSATDVAEHISNPTVQLWEDLEVYTGDNKPDFLVFDKYEMDAIPGASGIGYAWNGRDWDNYLMYVKQMSTALNDVPVMLWQIPGGHMQTQNGVDTRNSHASTGPDYFFGNTDVSIDLSNIKSYISDIILPTSAYKCGNDCSMTDYMKMNNYDWSTSNLQKAKDSNVFSILWGGGNTTSVGTFPQNDGGWLADKVNKYQKSPLSL